MESLYTAGQSRELDRLAIEQAGIPGSTLMMRAARAAFGALLARWPAPQSLLVLCGTGNNGGDGFLVADLAHQRGIPVQVLQLGDAGRIGGDAALARSQALANGVPMRPFDRREPLALPREVGESRWTGAPGNGAPGNGPPGNDPPESGATESGATESGATESGAAGIIVDAMLGTGLGGAVRGDYLAAIEIVNASGLPVMAVDIPSGLCSDTGRVLGQAVRADLTVSFIGLKRGLLALEAADCVGELQFDDLGVPDEVYRQVAPDSLLLDLDELLERLPPRPATAHKGRYGTVLVVGGDHGMAGAGIMAAEAALRTGAGLVRLATRPEHVAAAVARCPEIMAQAVSSRLELEPLLAGADVLVVGPGLGRSPWSEQLLQVAGDSGLPMLLDADGLNLLADGRAIAGRCRENWVLTPHPGEAARLLGQSTAGIQADRFAAARALQDRYGGTAVLKGNSSLVASPGRLSLCDYGNPGMASGGMGDVLSGVIGGLLAQGLTPPEAAELGVCLHGAAGDLAAEQGQRGLAATDLIPRLRALLG